MSGVVLSLKNRIFKRNQADDQLAWLPKSHWLTQLQDDDLRVIIHQAEQAQLLNIAPDIKGKRVFLVTFPHSHFLVHKIHSLGPELIVHYQIDQNYPSPAKNIISIKGDMTPLPIKSCLFDMVFIPVASHLDESFVQYLPELSKVLKMSGRFIFSVMHPMLELLLTSRFKHRRLRQVTSLQGYFKQFRDNHLYIENIMESFFDQRMAGLLKSQGLSSMMMQHSMDDLIGIPCVLLLRAVRYMKKISKD